MAVETATSTDHAPSSEVRHLVSPRVDFLLIFLAVTGIALFGVAILVP